VVPDRVFPGGLAAVRLEYGGVFLSVRAAGQELPPPAADARAVFVGVDLDQPPGRVAVIVKLQREGKLLRIEKALRVDELRYPTQRLTLPPRFDELDAPTLERIAAEKAVMDRLWSMGTPRQWREPFDFPLPGHPLGSGFGLRRVINGEPRAPHSGLDLPASAGTPVIGANAGRVVLVADHFFSGTSVVIDHGESLFTMYFHLQDALVQPGQRVERGQLIGHVGSTGRSSGPHLHWGVRLQGARVDPRELVRVSSATVDLGPRTVP
jgi:murein DD-endopeptidase MepM/ murein hydrolase activator NlpD